MKKAPGKAHWSLFLCHRNKVKEHTKPSNKTCNICISDAEYRIEDHVHRHLAVGLGQFIHTWTLLPVLIVIKVIKALR